MKLLLHICCGPCSIYPFSKLRKEDFEIVGFFYNPNIYPEEEFLKRRDALHVFSQREKIPVIYCEYNPEEFFSGIESQINKPERCIRCWEMRLLETVKYAKENNFSFYSTTLLISLYQDHEKIRELGENIGRRYGINFLYRDFRIGFRDSQKIAREMGLYRQNYCGCLYSKVEREEIVMKKR